jgi:predicted NAD-dependent protein-ADP-ribosyltransferase YbiA (DUF1768 family)
MKYILSICFLIVLSCTGKLTDEQKRKIREEREESQLKKISEADITEAAFKYGRMITSIIEKRDVELKQSLFIDSLEKVFSVEIISMKTDDATLRVVEKQVIDAYVSGGNVTLDDNVQKMGNDSVLYTKPLMHEMPDGSVVFAKALGLRMSKREIIRTIQ